MIRLPSPHPIHQPVPPEVVRAKGKTKVKRVPLVTGPKTMELEDKIVANVAKFLVPLPPQAALNLAVTAVTDQRPALAVAMVRLVQIFRSVPIVE